MSDCKGSVVEPSMKRRDSQLSVKNPNLVHTLKSKVGRRRSSSSKRSTGRQSRSFSRNLFKVESAFGAKKKPLYIKNMEYLMKKAKEKTKLKEFLAMHLELRKRLDDYIIPDNQYYMTKMMRALVKGNKASKLNKSFLEHFSLNCQSCLYLKTVKKPSRKELRQKMITLPKRKSSIFTHNI